MTKNFFPLFHIFCFICCTVISFFLISKNNFFFSQSYFLTEFLVPLQNYFPKIPNLFSLREKNLTLKRQNLRLILENRSLKQNYLQYQRIENRFLKFKDESTNDLLLAKVISKSLSPYKFDWVIDVGKKDLVKKNMPVLTDMGLIGKIKKVYKDYSIVQAFQDKSFKLSVLSQRSREIGLLESYSESSLAVSFPIQVSIFPGDTLVTSGFSVFPKGFLIGIVTFQEVDFHNRAGRKFIVEPFADYLGVEEVFVYRTKGLK